MPILACMDMMYSVKYTENVTCNSACSGQVALSHKVELGVCQIDVVTLDLNLYFLV